MNPIFVLQIFILGVAVYCGLTSIGRRLGLIHYTANYKKECVVDYLGGAALLVFGLTTIAFPNSAMFVAWPSIIFGFAIISLTFFELLIHYRP